MQDLERLSRYNKFTTVINAHVCTLDDILQTNSKNTEGLCFCLYLGVLF